MSPLSVTQRSFSAAKIREIRLLFSYGFNASEVAGVMGIHRVTVQRYRRMLKEKYQTEVMVDRKVLC